MTKIVEQVKHPFYGKVSYFIISTESGKDFKVIGYPDVKDASLRIPGYIITKEGELIIIPESVYHAVYFSNFIRLYTDGEDTKNYDTNTGALNIANKGFLVYVGLRDNDIYNGEIAGNIIFYLPPELTKEQYEVYEELMTHNDELKDFIDSNKIEAHFIDCTGEIVDKVPLSSDNKDDKKENKPNSK